MKITRKGSNFTALIILLTFNSLFAFSQNELKQTVRGQIIDTDTKIPLIGATILVEGIDPVMGTTADLDGNFRLERVPVGRHNFKVSFVGYEPLTVTEVLVTSGKEVVLVIELKESSFSLDVVVVRAFQRKDKPLNSMAMVSARSFSVEETRRYGGGLDDPARMVTAFAGVLTGGDMQDNALSIRGNSPKNVAWRLEGVDIPNPNHFAGGNVAGGGMVSLLSSQMLTNSDFFTSAFPAEYGNALGGVFDIKMRTGNNQKRESTFQIGVIGIDISSEGPFVKGKNATYLFNYRYSTLGLLANTGIIPSEQIPQFQDLSFKLHFPTKKIGVFNLWGIGGLGYSHQPVNTDSTTWVAPWSRIKFDWNINPGAIGLNHRYYNGNKTNFNTTIAVSGVYDKWIFTRLNDDLLEKPNLNAIQKNGKITLAHQIQKKYNQKISSKTGVNYNQLFYDTKINATIIEEKPETYAEFINEIGTTAFIEAYSQFKYDITPDLILNVGVHTNYFHLTQKYSIEPRTSIKWSFNERQSIALGYGKHSQIEELKIYFVKKEINGQEELPNKNLDFAKSHHFVISHDWLINKNLRLKTEPYLQCIYDAPGIPLSSYSVINYKQEYAFKDVMENNSIGRNFGIDFTFERFFNNNYYYLFTTSIFDSKYKGDDGVWRNTLYDRKFAFNLLFGKDFFLQNNRNVLSINLRGNYMGGQRDAPMLWEESIQERMIIYDYDRIYEHQYPAELYADVSLSYRINRKKYSSVWALQVKNITGNKSSRGYYYDYRTEQLEENTWTVIIPMLSYKIEL